MAVVGYALEVRMELEAVHRELAMALEEANGQGTLAQHALDADGDLRFVGALDEDAPAGGLDDGGVVEADTLAACEFRLLVGIDGEDREQRIAPAHHFQDVAGTPPDRILRAVEIDDADRCPQFVDHRHRVGRRCVDLLSGQVDVGIVKHQRDVCQHPHAEPSDDTACRIEPCPDAS